MLPILVIEHWTNEITEVFEWDDVFIFILFMLIKYSDLISRDIACLLSDKSEHYLNVYSSYSYLELI